MSDKPSSEGRVDDGVQTEGATESSPAADFEWGQRILIDGKPYWLNRCGAHGNCPSTSPTYHVIAGEPEDAAESLIAREDGE